MSSTKYNHPPYKPGDVIVKTSPLIYSLVPETVESRCSACFVASTRSIRLLKCQRCLHFAYCSSICQKFDWDNFHRHGECTIHAKFGESDVFRKIKFARVYLRCLILIQKRPLELTKLHELLGGEKKSFMDLMDHEGEFRADHPRMHLMRQVMSFFYALGLKFSRKRMQQILYRFHINSFDIYNFEMLETIGIGLSVETSIFDHSCDPNAALIFNGLAMQVRAIKEIAADEPVRFSYYDILFSLNTRRTFLKSQYYFDCSCPRCSNAPQGYENIYSLLMVLSISLGRSDPVIKSNARSYWIKMTRVYGCFKECIRQVYTRYHPTSSFHQMYHFLLCKWTKQLPHVSAEHVLRDLTVTYGPQHEVTKFFKSLKGTYNL